MTDPLRAPYTLVFTPEEVDLLLRGLGELPTRMGYNLVTRLGTEIAQENQRRQQPGIPETPIPGEPLLNKVPPVVPGTLDGLLATTPTQ